MASTFNICAVAIDWRLIVDTSSAEAQGQHIQDPRWLVAVNALSLAVALVANFALLAHMEERVRFNVAAPVVILGWYTSGIIDIALVAAAPRHVPLPDIAAATWSQAYYYAILSGAIYVLLAMMLTVTAFGVWYGQISHSFKLTLAQRSLMLQTMLFLGYVLAAGAVYSRIEGWVFLDSFYFTVVTLFTIGFGDFTPHTHLGRSLFLPFAVGGILFVGMIIANIRTLVLECASVKVSTRMVEKARWKAISSGDPANGILKIRGVKRRDTNAATEFQRREKEFYAMRDIQQAAAHNNRMFALVTAIAAFMLLWFVGAACFWQAEKAVGGQNWTYFESVYFTYVAQLTIGYGDFEPQTNSAKPAFVFWALIALPTLTVLIGAVGDSVTEAVNWVTIWLPKQARQVTKLSWILRSDSSGDSVVKEKGQGVGSLDGFETIEDFKSGEVFPADLVNLDRAQLCTARLQDAYRPYLLLRAAQKVMDHLEEDTPKRYSYAGWNWLLKLLREDEATEDGHRRVGQPISEGDEVAAPVRNHERQVWSWLGQESPLMDLRDGSEAKWALKRLLDVLEQELKQRGNDQTARDLLLPQPEIQR